MSREAVSIHICQVHNIAKVGSADAYRKKDGSFIMVEGCEPNSDGYDALWKVNAPLQRSMVAEPDYTAIPVQMIMRWLIVFWTVSVKHIIILI